ncbi:glycoside hydrolase family 5 protein [Roseimarinus sediminis]|uniref:glycoside hydrolase family 5 protein n=1 Tax=Roseimarinus sediminis TaxID=1610899 RepID=UPI003D1EF1C9
MKASTFTLLTLLGLLSLALTSSAFSPVKKYGQLKVDGTHIVSENGEIVQLTGMSLFWSQWIGQYYNKECISWLKEDWKCSVVRAAIAVDQGGYASHPKDEFRKAQRVIDAAIDQGIYVIVDLHTHHAEDYSKEAIEFFGKIAEKYGKHPNIIYEIYNEPLKISWSKVIKPYSEKVIAAIRQYDKNNIIVCGTPYWSQRVDEAAMDPIEGNNIAYTLHFYAGTHGEELRKRGDEAMAKGLCLFVTEYGTTEANGDGNVYKKETREWYNWMDKHHISHCNWSIADKNESSAALVEGASGKGGWKMEDIKPSGQLVRKELISKHQQYFGQ